MGRNLAVPEEGTKKKQKKTTSKKGFLTVLESYTQTGEQYNVTKKKKNNQRIEIIKLKSNN